MRRSAPRFNLPSYPPTPIPRIQVVYQQVAAICPDPKNPRVHSPLQIRRIADSIRSFGFNVPVLVDGKGKIIAGHGRVLAAQSLGMVEVPTLALDHLTPQQAQAFMVADNRLTEIATWDDQLLGEIFQELSTLDLNFRLDVTGFELAEIDLRIEGLKDKEDDPEAADEIPEPPSTIPVSKPGDLWLLGRHRVLCGNALEVPSYRELMAGRKAALVFTDPPYNVPIEGHVSGLGQFHHRDFAMACGEMSADEFTDFLTAALSLAAGSSKPGSLHYICMDWRHIEELLAAGQSVFQEFKNLCVWVKDNAGMGSFYRSQHELIAVFKNGSAPHQNNVQLGKYGRSRSNVWHYPGVNSFGRNTEEGNLLALHPTVKPVALIADALMDSSSRGDLVLDPFLGSGSTLMAAERVGRICYGLELEPLYVDTIVRRWEAWTGRDALHAASGTSFKARVQAALESPTHQAGEAR
jgi:DNA modification methylase